MNDSWSKITSFIFDFFFRYIIGIYLERHVLNRNYTSITYNHLPFKHKRISVLFISKLIKKKL